ncbi:Olfactory receptor 2B6 [Sciurus carolinensis]|uniref:Olfactory receptor 2B6 n=1 Tax=Sciurus carolinensis TaxID=30640 RepID=A0AA41ML86_SCICA|nr:Olfactory receptor 2B6 [Sciurus carolinensis]
MCAPGDPRLQPGHGLGGGRRGEGSFCAASGPAVTGAPSAGPFSVSRPDGPPQPVVILVPRLDARRRTPLYFCLGTVPTGLCHATCAVPRRLVSLSGGRKVISFPGRVARFSRFWPWGQRSASCWPSCPWTGSWPSATRSVTPLSCALGSACGWPPPPGRWALGTRCGCPHSPSAAALRPRVTHRFLCEVPALLRPSSVDTTASEAGLFFVSVVSTQSPDARPPSYACIAPPSSDAVCKGRRKALDGWRPSLVVTLLWLGYFQVPAAPLPSSRDWGKKVSLFYGAFAPMLNPLFYTLRNREVKDAFRRRTARVCPLRRGGQP